MDSTLDRHATSSREASTGEARGAGTWPWLGLATVGLVLVFVGLGIDAWRHNVAPGEETLLSFSNPGHALAGLGLGVIAMAVLGGLAAQLAAARASVDDTMRAAFAVTIASTAIVSSAVGALIYISATDATVGHTHGESLASASGGQNHAGHMHDHGAHPTLAEFRTMSDAEFANLVPANTVRLSEVPLLRAQVEELASFTRDLTTVEAANAAGYEEASADVNGMGAHYLNMDYLTDGVFDPSKPEGLLFSDIGNGSPELVGVWFLQLPGSDGATPTTPPVGFASELDLWHGHEGICYVGNESVAESVSEAACAARDGLYIGDQRWMMHVWIASDTVPNADGFFAYINDELAEKQVASKVLGQGFIP